MAPVVGWTRRLWIADLRTSALGGDDRLPGGTGVDPSGAGLKDQQQAPGAAFAISVGACLLPSPEARLWSLRQPSALLDRWDLYWISDMTHGFAGVLGEEVVLVAVEAAIGEGSTGSRGSLVIPPLEGRLPTPDHHRDGASLGAWAVLSLYPPLQTPSCSLDLLLSLYLPRLSAALRQLGGGGWGCD